MKHEIAVIDICGTLFDSNTTFDFLDFYIRSRRFVLFRKISKCYTWRIFNKVCFRLTGFDLTRRIALKSLRGHSRQEIASAAENFYDSVLVNKIHKPVQDIVLNLKRSGCRLCLASATLDCIADVVARKWDIDICYSSSLSYSGSVCEGRLLDDLLAKKIECLKLNHIYPPYDLVLTDDFTDIELLRNSTMGFVVSEQRKIPTWVKRLKKQRVENYKLIIL